MTHLHDPFEYCRREAIYLNDADRRAWVETLDPIFSRLNWVGSMCITRR